MKSPPHGVSLDIDRTLNLPVYQQICVRFRTAIEQRHLRANDRVPSIRALAAKLNVSCGTVDLAYRILIDEGYLHPRGAAGTVVSPSLPSSPQVLRGKARPITPHAASVDYEGRERKSLLMGLPALDAFPRKIWNRLVGHRLRTIESARLGFPNPVGDERLREKIAAYLGVSRGVSCLPEQVFVTSGLRNSLELILSSLALSGDEFWLENPGYILARLFLQNTGLKLVPVPVDDNGMIVEHALLAAPSARFAMITPAHQSPLGVTLSLERRLAILDWANKADSWIIEDDYDSEFRYQGRPLPALKSLDRNDRVIYSGTFSKSMFPGLRLAYIVVPLKVASAFRSSAYSINAGCPYLYQAAVADFIADGHFSRHLKKMRLLYAQRRALTEQVFSRVLGSRIQIELQPGGLHMLLQLTSDEDDVMLTERAHAAGLALHPLSRWYFRGKPRRGFLLGFANVTNEQEAVELATRLKLSLT